MKKCGLRCLMCVCLCIAILCTLPVVAVQATPAAGTDTALTIEAKTLSFKDNVYIQYAVRVENADVAALSGDDFGMLFWLTPRADYTVGGEDSRAQTLGWQTVNGKTCWIFSYEEFSAKQMTDILYARAYLRDGGNIYYSEVTEYSIATYASRKLGLTEGVDGTTDENLKTVLRNMLAYGASVQTYFGYRTDFLATDMLRPVVSIGVHNGTLVGGGTEGLYLTGKTVTLTASEQPGMEFVNWTDVGGTVVSGDSTATLTVTGRNEYTANFTPLTVTSPSVLASAAAFGDTMKMGWNLGNSMEAHYAKGDDLIGENLNFETIYGNPAVTPELLEAVRDLGFDVVRIPCNWTYHTVRDGEGHLQLNAEWLARLKEVVGYALDAGFAVILNTHHDDSLFYVGTTEENFAIVTQNTEDVWGGIAAAFSSYDGRVMFEAFNELSNLDNSDHLLCDATAAEQMNRLNQTFVTTVRAKGGNNAARILIVPTFFDSASSIALDSFVLPTDTVSDRLMVTCHCYDPQYAQDVEDLFIRLEAFSVRVNAPVYIGEFGTTTAYISEEYRAIHAGNFVARAKAHGIQCIWWDNGGDYKVIDRTDLTAVSPIVACLMNPVAYTEAQTTEYTKIDSFICSQIPSLDTGELKTNTGWGSISTVTGGVGIAIPTGATHLVAGSVVRGAAQRIKIHGIYFYEADGNYISGTNSSYGSASYTQKIPDGAAYVIISLYDAHTAFRVTASSNPYADFLAEGDLKLTLSWATQNQISAR